MDRILIKDLRIFAYHGVNPEEKRDGQNFVLDLAVSLDLEKARLTDDLADTVSYAKIIKTATAVFTSEKYDLLERAAEQVADGILKEYPPAQSVMVTLKKPDAPIKADFGYVAVEITKTRQKGGETL